MKETPSISRPHPVLELLYKAFFLRRIYFTQTPASICLLYGLILIFGLAFTSDRLATPALKWLWLIYLYLLIRTSLRLAIVRWRKRQRNYNASAHPPVQSLIMNSTASYELDVADETQTLDEGPGWRLYDATFNFYRHTKYGRFLSKQAYYTIIEVQLSRQVPHLIFDSKTAKRSQFRYLYLQSQRISLEGDFDTYFETYAPHTYHIDSLSFITPEVMLALITAKDYDIELMGDRVLLYGPLLDLKDAERLKTLGLAIGAHLNDNLDNYRDTRLNGADSTEDVTPFARKLLKSPMKYLPVLVATGLGSLVIFYFALTYSPRVLMDQLSLIILITFISTLATMIKVLRENKKLEQEYRDLLTAHKKAG